MDHNCEKYLEEIVCDVVIRGGKREHRAREIAQWISMLATHSRGPEFKSPAPIQKARCDHVHPSYGGGGSESETCLLPGWHTRRETLSPSNRRVTAKGSWRPLDPVQACSQGKSDWVDSDCVMSATHGTVSK